MVDFLIPYVNLYYHRIDVRIVVMQDTTFNAWPGAVIRNNLLFASEQILVPDGISLREKINKIPLSELHPLYRDLSGGFRLMCQQGLGYLFAVYAGVGSGRWRLTWDGEDEVEFGY